MNCFPTVLKAENKEIFKEIYCDVVLCSFRERVYCHILLEDENNYFDLDIIKKTYKLTDEQHLNITDTIIQELEELGWKCKKSFGQTALFIYSTENPPPSCWDDSLV
jgi:hypothetical protein